MTVPLTAAAKAVREEIVRQYRDDERSKCPGGAAFYEEHIAPGLIAEAALSAITPAPESEWPTWEQLDEEDRAQLAILVSSYLPIRERTSRECAREVYREIRKMMLR